MRWPSISAQTVKLKQTWRMRTHPAVVVIAVFYFDAIIYRCKFCFMFIASECLHGAPVERDASTGDAVREDLVTSPCDVTCWQRVLGRFHGDGRPHDPAVSVGRNTEMKSGR